MHMMLNEQFNDGKQYRLHYVTARQAFNIAKAAEDGKTGDPSQWLDYRVAKQPHSFYMLTARHRLVSCTAEHIRIENIESGDAPVVLSLANGFVKKASGAFTTLQFDVNMQTTEFSGMKPNDVLDVTVKGGAQMIVGEGCKLLDMPGGVPESMQSQGQFRVTANAQGCAVVRAITAPQTHAQTKAA